MKIERVREPEDETRVDHHLEILEGSGRTLLSHFLNNDPFIEFVMNIKPDYDAIGNAISESYCIWKELKDDYELHEIHEIVKINEKSIFEKYLIDSYHDFDTNYIDRINWSRVEKRLPKKVSKTFSLKSILNSCSLEMEPSYQLVELLLKSGMELASIKDKNSDSEIQTINQEMYRKIIITHLLLENPKELGFFCREIYRNRETVAKCAELLKQHYGIVIQFD